MAAKTNYFSHDAGARNDSKVVRLRMRHGAEGYGVYFMLLERLREESDYCSTADYEMIAFDLRVDTELVRSVVEDFGLFRLTTDGTRFYSESFNERMSVKDEVSRKRSESGKRGLQKRWNSEKDPDTDAADSKPIANATQTDSKPIANATETDSKETKESKESKERISPPPATRTREDEPCEAEVIASEAEDAATEAVAADIKSSPSAKPAKSNARPTKSRAKPTKPMASSALDREAAWLAELRADRQFLQTLAVNTRAPDEATIIQALADFHAEARAKDIHHADRGDYRRHAYDWIRRHLEILRQNEQRTATHTAPRLQPARGHGETDDDFCRRIVTTVAAASAAPPPPEPTRPLW